MTKYVLIMAYPNGMKIGIDSEVFETEGELISALESNHDMEPAYINDLMDDGEVEVDYTDEPMWYKLQVVA